MKPKQLSSGKWRIQVYDKTTKKRISITRKTKKETERAAQLWYETHGDNQLITFKEAYDGYIASKKNVLSPNTIQTYNDYSVYYNDINAYPLQNITNAMLQNFVNKLCEKHKPKTVKNIYGLITAIFALYLPDRRLVVTLPKNVSSDNYIPSENDINKLLEAAKGTELLTPIELAVFATMRLSEITALDLEHIEDDMIHIEYAMALKDGEYVKKAPKTMKGNRWASCPPFVIERIRNRGYVTKLTSREITCRYRRLIKKLKFEKSFTFHSLRHYSASKQHALGIPDLYIMEQAGWESDIMLKKVYGHALKEERRKNSEKWLKYLEKYSAAEQISESEK